VSTAIEWVVPGDERDESAPPGPELETHPSGIALAPGSRLVIEFLAPPGGSRARVTLTEREDVVVRGPAGSATFSSEADRLLVEPRGVATTFDIEIPRSAPDVEIRAAGALILSKKGARLESATPAEPGDSYVLPLAPDEAAR
jgi:hypothetical protein